MKHKKVLALLISAGLTASSLHGCSLMPQTAFGMETEEQKAAGEDMTDGTEENAQDPAPADEMPAPEEGERTGSEEIVLEAAQEDSPGTDEGSAQTADPDGADVEPQTAAEGNGGDEAHSSDETGTSSGQETVAPSPEEPSDHAGSSAQEETGGVQETETPASQPATEGTTEKPSGTGQQGSPGEQPQSEPGTETERITETLNDQPGSESEPAAEEQQTEEPETMMEELQTEEIETEVEEDLFEDSGYGGAYYSNGSYWDKSWYFKRDFRFTQVDKVFGIAGSSRLARIYEAPDTGSGIVGEIPYFGLAYVLDEKDGFYYIESGDARGFIPKEDLSVGDHTDETVDLLGEEAFEEADADVEIPDNAAFTFTKTTTHDVVTEKDYAITYMPGSILEYPKDGARTVGEIGNGTLVYVLEDAGDGWLFVESGDVRGFVKASTLLTGEGAKAVTEDMGEGTISLAEEVITPEENRSLYYTLTSVKPAVDQMGESVCEYALSFEGKLPYVYGGTSLGFGADCSGFTQSVFGCFGISIPRTAQEQGASGQVVNGLDDARPGDIIYYGSGPHVGIYLGDGKVIQCSGNESNTASNPGKGPTISAADYMPITSIRRYIIETKGEVPGISESGNRQDGSVYSQDQLELIWAIVAQEDNGSYEGALAVISSAMNRTESERWSGCGGDALTQLTAPGQYCYSLDDYWRPRLGGNVPEYVKQAVNDCLVKGIRNHNHTSFRSTKGKTTGNDAVQIGGNWYFGT